MQSYIEHYISTFSIDAPTTPAVVSYIDALTIVEKWAKKDFGTFEKVKKEYIPGFFLYETPEGKSEFPVSEVRNFITDTSKRPYEGKNLYILFGIDTASLEAMNALLKILEDTPKYAIIILVVSDRERLVETIHSRTIDIFRPQKYIPDTTYEAAICEFFAGKKETWIATLFGMKPSREEAIDILTIALKYGPDRYITLIEDGFLSLYTTNESPRNILDIVFLQS